MQLLAFQSLVAAALALSGGAVGADGAAKPEWSWYEVDAQRNVRINLYLFWSKTCPHCPPAVDFANSLKRRYSWLNLYALEISESQANRDLYRKMAESLNRAAGTTPAFFYCKQLTLGYISYPQTGRAIDDALVRWHKELQERYRKPSSFDMPPGVGAPQPPPIGPDGLPDPEPPPPVEEKLQVPGWGEVDPDSLSLPAFTLVIAACDAFNPCAFFVLLLLLSLLVHGRSRFRMFVVGAVFVFFSGLMYFLFMAAWLNLFYVIGHVKAITAAAGAFAVFIGLLNVKDFFWFKQGPSLSIPEGAKPGLFRRMTGLINASSLPSLIGGAAALAAVANLYELLCTSGFPMVYTRVLTLRDLSTAQHYGYLALYNLIYVAPLALIVCVFAFTLGAWKLSEFAGRTLKLLSGLMMLSLGVVLVFWPDLLHSALGAAAILVAAGLGTAAIAAAERWLRGAPPPPVPAA